MCTRFFAAVIFSCTFLLYTCGEKEDDSEEGIAVANSYKSTVLLPENGKAYVIGDKIPFKITFSDKGQSLEGIVVKLDDRTIFQSKDKKELFEFETASDTLSLGLHNIKVESSINDGTDKTVDVETVEYDFMLLSNVKPESYSYKVTKKYPHDPSAYTQGLVFENGFLYEGTGLEGKSSLRLVDYKNNKIIRSINLDKTFFGEGIALVNDKIFQLTYTTKKGFVYDKNNFKVVREFEYPTQGWGLTYDGTDLILSDGTSYLYFYEPETFKLKRKVMVVDDVSDWGLINELEYINGEIWANIYQTNMILRIDPKTGKVLGKIDMAGLLSESELMNVDVLNGIAYDAFTKTIFVTGKNWPWLFEIELVKTSALANK